MRVVHTSINTMEAEKAAKIDLLHLRDSIYRIYLHSPGASFSDDDLLAFPTLGELKAALEWQRNDTLLKLETERDSEERSELEEDIGYINCDLESIRVAIKDYCSRTRLDRLVDPNKTPTERWS